MRLQDKEAIDALRQKGLGYTKISDITGIPRSTVKYYIGTAKPSVPVCVCRQCGAPLERIPGRKAKIFCSDSCRSLWWNSHKKAVSRQTYREFTCAFCGKEFTSYGNRDRKYCSHSCAGKAVRDHPVQNVPGAGGCHVP